MAPQSENVQKQTEQADLTSHEAGGSDLVPKNAFQSTAVQPQDANTSSEQNPCSGAGDGDFEVTFRERGI